MKFDPALLVYTSDKRGFRAIELTPLFERLLRQNRPVVLFIHGRGGEPEKSLEGTGFIRSAFKVEGKAVPKIEAFGAVAAMFSWDSKRGGFLFFGLSDRERPLGNVDAAADSFKVTLDKLAAAIATVGAARAPLTLLAHSMGTIVLQRYIEKNGWPAPVGAPLFRNVIVSSADADNLGHTAWVDRIAAVERVFITLNPKDPILEDSKEKRQPNALPLGMNPGNALSAEARYVDITIGAHEVFSKGHGHPEIERFFAAAFAGDDPLNGARGRVRL